MTHICVGKQTIIGSDNGLSPGRRQAIILTNARILLIGPLGRNFSEISIKILTFSFTKMHLKVSSGKQRPSCLGLNVLNSVLLLPWYDYVVTLKYVLRYWPLVRECSGFPAQRASSNAEFGVLLSSWTSFWTNNGLLVIWNAMMFWDHQADISYAGHISSKWPSAVSCLTSCP